MESDLQFLSGADLQFLSCANGIKVRSQKTQREEEGGLVFLGENGFFFLKESRGGKRETKVKDFQFCFCFIFLGHLGISPPNLGYFQKCPSYLNIEIIPKDLI